MSKVFKESVGPLFSLQEHNEGVGVFLVDNTGKPLAGGHIVDFTYDGRMVLVAGISPTLGLQLSKEGKIIIA